MNIVLVHTHDSGRFIEPYGYGVETPHLMKFAERASLFRNAYCAGPTCSPSRSALMTGMYPHSCGMFGLAHRGFKMPDYQMHLGRFLNMAAGFETVLCGIQHEAPDASMIGYSRILGNQDYNMGDISFSGDVFDFQNAELCASYIREEHEKPFFLSFGLFSTHRKYPQGKTKVNPNYVLPAKTIADSPDNRQDMADFMYSLSVADDCFGIVYDALKEKELLEDTIVVFTTDHGPAVPNMKCTLYDDGIGISLIIDYPGNTKRGKVIDALVSQVDLFPTFCDICKIDYPSHLQGKTLVPLMENDKNIHQSIFAEVNYHACYEPMRCIRTERFKYIKRYEQDLSVIPANIDDSPGKKRIMDCGYASKLHSREELYDLYMDPLERVNYADSTDYSDVKKALSDELYKWMEDTKDPILLGKIEPPKGASLNSRTSLSAEEKTYMV